MKKLLCMIFIIYSHNIFSLSPSDIISEAELFEEGAKIVKNIGLNCADPASLPKNIGFFVAEATNILAGISRVITETGLLLALKKDYPTVCNVLTRSQINSYSEGERTHHKSYCVIKTLFGCALRHYKRITNPIPSYYWPKYFIEVLEKGNDPHSSFARGNGLYSLNRKISGMLSKFIDIDGAISLTKYVMGGKALIGTVAPQYNIGEQDWNQVTRLVALTPLQKMRMRASTKVTQPSYDVNIWPVALSELIARHFTVCGSYLTKIGKDPGGYSWPFKGVPMTCPVAMTNDAYAYWDTGLLDYIDVEAISAMAAGSNPLTCGMAAGMDYLASSGKFKGNFLGETKNITSALSQLSNKMSKALQVCSFPILGKSQAIASKALSSVSPAKWTQMKCTLWGSVAPRSSTSVYNNDYSFANAGLKFKLLAHELFGLPRGEQERWSLAYPWEGPGASMISSGSYKKLGQVFSKLTGNIGGKLRENKINLPKSNSGGSSRSEALLIPGSPLMVNASYSEKALEDKIANTTKELAYIGSFLAAGKSSVGAGAFFGAEIARSKTAEMTGYNPLPGEKRIYTIWEKVSCEYPVRKVKNRVSGVTWTKYEDSSGRPSCQEAIRFELYKFIQLRLVRKICDLLGQGVGDPWK